ncbi:kinase-like protein [Wolfiporia cocos MD-104 SS10]|uniref:Kinase-like protein n=1 Tax=Wolfiporia cocos (strain MD-104) TaxID=742152 RepID=A0A2H3J1P0_WOLCO|nr:kinase-like protein [Wolfiporia cocos MD-104 SS10]
MSSSARHIKKITLTSKKNWWMVELDDEEDRTTHILSPTIEEAAPPEPHHLSRQVFTPPNNPLSIFSFPTPTTYSAPPNPTQNLAPCASGSASELFKCIVKKPNVVQLEINGEMQSNANDVITQFLAELRVYTTLARHRNIAAFLGCLENVGMVLEYVEGRTLWDVIKERPELTRSKKIDFHNQLLDGLTHLHSYGLSHGDLSLLNVQVTHSSDTIKLLDFGRSVSAESTYASPFEDPSQPPEAPVPRPPVNSRFAPKSPHLSQPSSAPPPPPRQVERIHPGTRPFSAPEVLRGECQDALLADAYSFGMILVCLDRCDLVDVKPWVQRKDALPKGFLDGLSVFGNMCEQYLRRWDDFRRRLVKEDMMDVEMNLN